MANTSILTAFERMWQHVVIALNNSRADLESSINTKVSYDKVLSLTPEQQGMARENIRAAIDIYDIVSPEMFGAVGDGVTDDSEAFINAFLSGKKVVCDSTKTYFFENPVDIRTLKTGHLDGNGAKFINFHIYININDEFTDWRHEYSADKFIIENMHFGLDWETLPVGWETPLITTGSPMIVRNIVTRYPYVLATTDSYIDYMLCDGWNLALNIDLFNGNDFNLDAISCLNKNGEYCRFSTSNTPAAAGDCWRILQCNEFSILEHPEYNMMGLTGRRPIFIDSCVQSSFTIYHYCQPTFNGCHWETKSNVTFHATYLTTINFINCFFYNNHILSTGENTTYEHCSFAAAGEQAIAKYTLSYNTQNKSFYDIKCKLINCLFGKSTIDTRLMHDNKYAVKKTHNWMTTNKHDYRPKLSTKTFDINTVEYRRNAGYLSAGDYVYDIYLRATSLPNVAVDYAQLTATITDAASECAHLSIPYVSGGCSLCIIRTDPDGKMKQADFYADPNFSSGYVKFTFEDNGSYAQFLEETDDADEDGIVDLRNNFCAPWIEIEEKPTFVINEVLYEASGVLKTTDGSAAELGFIDGQIQIGNEVLFTKQALSDDQKIQTRNNIGAASQKDIDIITAFAEAPININDEVYTYARFNAEGNVIESGQVTAIMTENYLPVDGGETIEAIYGDTLYHENFPVQVVQYNKNKEVIVGRTELRPKIRNSAETPDSSIPKQLTLNNETAFIRFSVAHWRSDVALDNNQITIAYVYDDISEYVDHTQMKERIFVKNSAIAGLSNMVQAPATISVGQVIAVKAVDEKGKPTEWEAVDMPTDDHIKALINEALEAIANGTY